MIDTVLWRVRVGLFTHPATIRKCRPLTRSGLKLNLRKTLCILTCVLTLWTINIPFVNTLILANDVELNPGPNTQCFESDQTTNPPTSDQANILRILEEIKLQNASNFTNLKQDISHLHNCYSELKYQIAAFQSDLDTIDNRLKTIEVDSMVIKDDVRDLTFKFEEVDEKLDPLASRVSALEETAEKLERYSRRENVLLHGIPERDGETPVVIRQRILSTLNSRVPVKSWQNTDIVRAHRLGRSHGSDPRPIIVRFTYFEDKLQLLRSRDSLREDEISVSSDLTSFQRQELKKLREAGKRGYYKNGRLIIEDAIDNPASQPTSTTSTRVIRNARRRSNITAAP